LSYRRKEGQEIKDKKAVTGTKDLETIRVDTWEKKVKGSNKKEDK